MDNNKLNCLREIGYTLRRTCGNCEHSIISHRENWGSCLRWQYDHLKHTSFLLRSLSVHEIGYCKDHKFKEFWLPGGILWEEFKEE